ncbi:MAG TPA: hypothetical protein VFA83_04090 [Acidimicrobiales bacterium]|nr:hypothetical protein [Acidimicrobiales bacterium]
MLAAVVASTAAACGGAASGSTSAGSTTSSPNEELCLGFDKPWTDYTANISHAAELRVSLLALRDAKPAAAQTEEGANLRRMLGLFGPGGGMTVPVLQQGNRLATLCNKNWGTSAPVTPVASE